MPYRILNWDEYQARTDRSSTQWVKLHKRLIGSYDFYSVPVNRRWEWPVLLLMSDNHDGIIKQSDEEIGFALYKELGKVFDPTPFLGRLLVAQGEPLDQSKKEIENKRETGFGVVSDGNHLTPLDTKAPQWKFNPADFEVFWNLYPLKKAKVKAEQAWRKLKPSKELQALILGKLAAQIKGDDWQRDGGRFIPHPTTYLNQERWNDEISKNVNSSKPAQNQGYGCNTCHNLGVRKVQGRWVRCECKAGQAVQDSDLEKANAA